MNHWKSVFVVWASVCVCASADFIFCSVVVWLFCCLVALFSFVSAITCEMGWNERLLCWTPSYIDLNWYQKHSEPQQILLFYHNKKKTYREKNWSERAQMCLVFATIEKSRNMWNGFWGRKKKNKNSLQWKKKVELEWRNEQNKDQHISCTVIHACRIMKKKHWNGHGRRWKNWLKFILMLLLLLAFFLFFPFLYLSIKSSCFYVFCFCLVVLF